MLFTRVGEKMNTTVFDISALNTKSKTEMIELVYNISKQSVKLPELKEHRSFPHLVYLSFTDNALQNNDSTFFNRFFNNDLFGNGTLLKEDPTFTSNVVNKESLHASDYKSKINAIKRVLRQENKEKSIDSVIDTIDTVYFIDTVRSISEFHSINALGNIRTFLHRNSSRLNPLGAKYVIKQSEYFSGLITNLRYHICFREEMPKYSLIKEDETNIGNTRDYTFFSMLDTPDCGIKTEKLEDVYVPITLVIFASGHKKHFIQNDSINQEKILNKRNYYINSSFFPNDLKESSRFYKIFLPESKTEFKCKTSYTKLPDLVDDCHCVTNTLTYIPQKYSERLLTSKLKNIQKFDKDLLSVFHVFNISQESQMHSLVNLKTLHFFTIRFDGNVNLLYYTNGIRDLLLRRFSGQPHRFTHDPAMVINSLPVLYKKCNTVEELFVFFDTYQNELKSAFNTNELALLTENMFLLEKTNALASYLLTSANVKLVNTEKLPAVTLSNSKSMLSFSLADFVRNQEYASTRMTSTPWNYFKEGLYIALKNLPPQEISNKLDELLKEARVKIKQRLLSSKRDKHLLSAVNILSNVKSTSLDNFHENLYLAKRTLNSSSDETYAALKGWSMIDNWALIKESYIHLIVNYWKEIARSNADSFISCLLNNAHDWNGRGPNFNMTTGYFTGDIDKIIGHLVNYARNYAVDKKIYLLNEEYLKNNLKGDNPPSIAQIFKAHYDLPLDNYISTIKESI